MDTQKTIILIEDELDLARMYQEVFRRHSQHTLINAPSKQEGLAAIQRGKPALVLLDLIIPERPGEGVSYERRVGFDLLQELRQHPDTKDLKVFVFSNMDSHEDRLRSDQLGVTEYLLKAEYTPQLLIQKINRYITA